MKTKAIWKYLQSGEVKHAFEKKKDKTSLCNTSTEQYNYIDWDDKPAELNKRRECSNCLMKLAAL